MIPRNDCRRYGIPYSAGYLANLDSAGMGPEAVRIGARVCYLRGPFIDWLCQRTAALGNEDMDS
jgi:hypothetical protein